MTTIRHGGPCGLRIEMRSAERRVNPVLFYATGDRWYHATASEGGVWHDFSLRSTTAAFVHLPHSAVVSQFENALPRPRGRMMARTRATPPKSGGSLSSSFIPAGRLGKTPFPLALDRGGSVLAVKGSLRRFAPWTAPGRSERRAAYEGKGGDRAVGREGELAHDKGYYHSYCRGRTGSKRASFNLQ